MDAAELGDGVIAVFEKDLVVEFLGASESIVASMDWSPSMSSSPTNSFKKSRRRLSAVRE